MKRGPALLLIPALLLSCAFFTVSTPAKVSMAAGNVESRLEKNLIQNGSFEEDFSDEGWSPDGCFTDEEHHSSGARSARLGPGESGCYYAITDGFAPGEEFILGASGSVSQEGETGIVNVEMRGDDGLILRNGLTFTNTGDMEEKDISLTIEEGTTKLMVCLYKEGGVGGYAYFDDIFFGKKIPEVKRNENLLSNPGFEGGLDGWDLDGIRFESEKIRSGEGAAYIGPGEGGGYVTVTGDFSEASKITISGWGCVSLEGDNALFGVDMFDNSDRSAATRIGKYQLKFSDACEYSYKSMDFDIAEGTRMITVFVYKEAGVGGIAYFDDLSVVVDKQEEELPGETREKIIINSPPEGVESEPAGFPDEYDHTEDGKDYYYREYKCFVNSLQDAGTAPGANYELTERLVGYGDHIRWYKREYKKLTRAMWVWNFDILEDEAKGDEFFAFLAEKNINTVFMNTGSDDSGVSRVKGHPDEYKKFIKRAHSMGVKVEALDGSSDWVRRENHSIPLGKINEVIAYNQSVDAAFRFDGIHHDNEPYTLPEWEANKSEIAKAYLDLAAESAKLAHSAGLTYAVDIPFWYDSVTETANTLYNDETKSLAYHIIDLVDYVGIMAYRDTALGTDGIIYHTEDEVRYAAFTDKDLVIGVETYDVPDHEANPPKVTFYQEGEIIMNREIGKVIDYYKNYYNKLSSMAAPGFKGIAIHYYDTYKDLPAERRDGAEEGENANEAAAVNTGGMSSEASMIEDTEIADAAAPEVNAVENEIRALRGRFVYHDESGKINGYGFTTAPDKAVLGISYEEGKTENYKEAMEILYVGNSDGQKIYRAGYEQKIAGKPLAVALTDNGETEEFTVEDADGKTIYLAGESVNVSFPEKPDKPDKPNKPNKPNNPGGSGSGGSGSSNSGQSGNSENNSGNGNSSDNRNNSATDASGKNAPTGGTTASVTAGRVLAGRTGAGQGTSSQKNTISDAGSAEEVSSDNEDTSKEAVSETVDLTDEDDSFAKAEPQTIEEEKTPLSSEITYDNSSHEQEASNKKGSKGPIIAILLLAIAALAGGGIWAARRLGDQA